MVNIIEEKKIEGKKIEVVDYLFKANCGFKEKAKICKFKKEDCNSEKCDFFNVEYSIKGIKKQIKFERKEIINLDKQKKQMKKNHEHKLEPEKYKKIKSLIKDKAMGIMLLTKAYMLIKRTK